MQRLIRVLAITLSIPICAFADAPAMRMDGVMELEAKFFLTGNPIVVVGILQKEVNEIQIPQLDDGTNLAFFVGKLVVDKVQYSSIDLEYYHPGLANLASGNHDILVNVPVAWRKGLDAFVGDRARRIHIIEFDPATSGFLLNVRSENLGPDQIRSLIDLRKRYLAKKHELR